MKSQPLDPLNWHRDLFPPLFFLWQWDIQSRASWETSHLPLPSPPGIWTKIPSAYTII